MASPAETTVKNLNGKFVMNKKLSDNPESLLILQGIGWLTRKAISIATVTLSIKEYQDQQTSYHIDITSNASGLSTTQEDRTLDWAERDHTDRIFGKVRGMSRFITLSAPLKPVMQYGEADLAFLQGKTLRDGKTASKLLDEEGVQSFVRNQDSGYGWTAEQVWNFEEIDGKRFHTRRIIVKNAKGDKNENARLVYDYLGPLNVAESADDDGLAYGEEE